MSAATISVHLVRGLFLAAAERGVAPPDLCSRFGVSAELLADDEGRVPWRAVLAMWTEVPALVGDAHFGLHLGERMAVPPHPVLGHAVRHCPTYAAALRCFFRYQRLQQNVTRGEVIVRDGAGHVLVAAAPEIRALPRHAIEFGFAATVTLGRLLTDVDVVPRRVAFQHGAPSDVSEHARVFRAPVSFGCSRNDVELDREVLEAPLRAADASLGDVLEKYARHLAAQLPEASDYTSRVRHALHEALRGGDPSLESIARKLGMSARTLQRRLRDEGTSHQAVVDAERERLARYYLAESELGIQEVAFMLGFSEQPTFHRAFLRWTGETPGAYRSASRRVGSGLARPPSTTR